MTVDAYLTEGLPGNLGESPLIGAKKAVRSEATAPY